MIVLVLLLGFLVRLINLDQSLWLDETISAMAVKSYDYFGLLTKFSIGDVHPPLYYLLLKFWTDLFGYSEISLRFPSVVAGVMSIFVVYRIGVRLFNKKIALLAALFLAVNPLAVYYAQEARMYSLETLFVASAVFFFVAKKWFWCLFFSVVAGYTDYFALFILPIFFPPSLLAIIFFLPWFPIFWQQLQTNVQLAQDFPIWGQVVGGFSFKALLLTPIKFIFGRIPSHPVMAFVAAFYFWLLIRARNGLLWAWLIIPISLSVLISIKIPVFTYHRFLFVMPAFVLLLASVAGKKSAIIVLIVSVISLFVFNLNLQYQREDWRSAVKYMESDPGIAVIPSLAQASPITYYNSFYPVYDRSNLVLSYQTPVYLIRYVQEIFDPQDSERNRLEVAGYKNVQTRSFNGVVIWKYQL